MTGQVAKGAMRGAAGALGLGAPSLLLAAPGRVVVPAGLPFRRGDDPADAYGLPLLIAIGVALFAVCAVAYCARQARKERAAGSHAGPAWLNWFGRVGSGDEVIALVCSKPLGPGVRLHVVQWNGQQYLLSNNQASITVLDRRPVAHAGAAQQCDAVPAHLSAELQ